MYMYSTCTCTCTCRQYDSIHVIINFFVVRNNYTAEDISLSEDVVADYNRRRERPMAMGWVNSYTCTFTFTCHLNVLNVDA